MEKTFTRVEELAGHIKEYVNSRMASAKLSAAEKTSAVLSGILAIMLVLVLFVFFILFSGIALALVFAELTGEYYLGFLLVAGMYLVCGVLVWSMKEKLIRLPIMNAILQQLFKEETDEQDQ